MRISKLIIKGFRSFDEEGQILRLRSDLTAFIGANSSGKTTAMEALKKLFVTSGIDKQILREDFHISTSETIDALNLSIEACLEFDAGDDDAIAHYFAHMVVESEGAAPFIRLRLEANWTKSDVVENGLVESQLYFIKAAHGEETDDDKRPCPIHLKSLIEIIYIPAIRRLAEQLKYVSSSIFYRLLRHVKFNDDFRDEFGSYMGSITTLFDGIPEFSKVKECINLSWKKFHKDSRYMEATINFGGSDHEAILKKLEIAFDPTGLHRPYSVDDLGDGYKSLFYITLVCALLEIEEKLMATDEEVRRTSPLLTIVALEEPENHIAPQLLGRVINNLKEISLKPHSQVVLSSHTSSIIKRVDPESLLHFRIDPDRLCSLVKKILLPKKTDEAYKYIKEAICNYPEIYFAKVVVIGEGDSEEILFNKLASVYNFNFDDNFVAFAPLGNRFVNHIWKLLANLDIPFVTLLDLDLGRDGGGWGRVKYALKQLLLIGNDRDSLLATNDGVLTDARLDGMHKWSNSGDTMKGWIKLLRDYDVFFSRPLDLDFMLLSKYKDDYIGTIDGYGPTVPDKELDPEGFAEKVKSSVQATLKSKTATGDDYSQTQKELMIYYNYFFLGRGKPSTHILALSSISDEDMKASIPIPLQQMFKRLLNLLGYSNES